MALAARKEAVARVLKERRQRLLTGVLAGPWAGRSHESGGGPGGPQPRAT